MYYQIKQVKILLKRGHTKMLIFDIFGFWLLYFRHYSQCFSTSRRKGHILHVQLCSFQLFRNAHRLFAFPFYYNEIIAQLEIRSGKTCSQILFFVVIIVRTNIISGCTIFSPSVRQLLDIFTHRLTPYAYTLH